MELVNINRQIQKEIRDAGLACKTETEVRKAFVLWFRNYHDNTSLYNDSVLPKCLLDSSILLKTPYVSAGLFLRTT